MLYCFTFKVIGKSHFLQFKPESLNGRIPDHFAYKLILQICYANRSYGNFKIINLMKYIADFHTHSRFSMATSKNSNLSGLFAWARVKGINVVGTGDFTHPEWFFHLKEKPYSYGTRVV